MVRLTPTEISEADLQEFSTWVQSYMDGVSGNGDPNQDCEVNPRVLAGVLKYLDTIRREQRRVIGNITDDLLEGFLVVKDHLPLDTWEMVQYHKAELASAYRASETTWGKLDAS